MTTHRERGDIVFECDGCDETLETAVEDFALANSLRKTENWSAEKVGDEWLHLCPSCGKKH